MPKNISKTHNLTPLREANVVSSNSRPKSQALSSRNPNIRSWYPSMLACSGATGIPRDILQEAKNRGCPAFDQANRVCMPEFIKWFFSQTQGDEFTDWQGLNTELDAKLKQVKLDRELRDLIAKDEVQAVVQQIISTCTTLLKRATIEFPKTLEMRAAAEIKGLCDPMYKDSIRRMELEFEKLNIKQKE